MTERRFSGAERPVMYLTVIGLVIATSVGFCQRRKDLQNGQPLTTNFPPGVLPTQAPDEANQSSQIATTTSPTGEFAMETCSIGAAEIPQWFLNEIGGAQVLKNFSSQQELVNYVNNLNPRVQDLKYEGVYYFPGELHSSPEIIIGSATFYSEDYKDKRTGFGDPYNPNLHTGATWLGVGGGLYQVTNLANCKSTYILANDRGPDRTHNGNTDRGRYVIDLSRAAFEDIANPSQGEIQIMARLVGFDALFEAAYPTIPPRKSSGIPPWHSGA